MKPFKLYLDDVKDCIEVANMLNNRKLERTLTILDNCERQPLNYTCVYMFSITLEDDSNYQDNLDLLLGLVYKYQCQ